MLSSQSLSLIQINDIQDKSTRFGEINSKYTRLRNELEGSLEHISTLLTKLDSELHQTTVVDDLVEVYIKLGTKQKK